MGYQREWVDDFDEGSEFDLAGSDDDGREDDPARSKSEASLIHL